MQSSTVRLKHRNHVGYLIVRITGRACFIVVIVRTQSPCEASRWCSGRKLGYVVAWCTVMWLTFRKVVFRAFETRTSSALTVRSSTAGCTGGRKGNTYRNDDKNINFLYIFAEYNQQDATFHYFFITVRRCTCFRRFSVHNQEIKTAHTASGICQTNTAPCR